MRRHPTGGAAQNTAKIAGNLRQATTAARSLAFASAGITGQLNSAVGASAAVAENLAKMSRNAKVAASATGIGAVVAIIGTAIAFAVDWSKATKDVALRIREVTNETAKLNAQARGDRRLERELEIQGAMEGELEAAKKLENRLQKFPQLQDAIRAKAQAARNALDADLAKQERERRRGSFEDPFFSIATDIGMLIGRRNGARDLGIRQAKADREEALRNISNTKGDEDRQLRELIETRYQETLKTLEYDLDAPSRALGDELGRSIVGGINDGINAALRGGIGEGLKALTGSILIGFGDMMQEIGTQSLLAAQLLKKVIQAFKNFAPDGAIAHSLALIAAGSVLKSLGASMQGSGGGGGGAGVSSSGRGALLGTVVSVGAGPVAAAGGPSAFSEPFAGARNLWVIGADDATAQRTLASMVERGNGRRGRK